MWKHVAAVVLCHNEEQNIAHCLSSLQEQMSIYVVDSGSEDNTVSIARQYGATVVSHAYTSHSEQWRWALETLPFRVPWALLLDADFVVSEELLRKIESELPCVGPETAGIYVRHIYRFARGVIRFGGTKKYWLRLVRVGRARPDSGDLVDFRMVVDGKTAVWPEAIIEYNRKDDDPAVWITKQDKFALRLAVEEELRRRRLHRWDGTPSLFGNTDERIAWLRDRWLNMPLFTRGVLYWVYRYLLAGGFLDGRAGFLYHLNQGLWLRVLVDWKIYELRQRGVDDKTLMRFKEVMLIVRSGSIEEIIGVMKSLGERGEADPGSVGPVGEVSL